MLNFWVYMPCNFGSMIILEDSTASIFSPKMEAVGSSKMLVNTREGLAFMDIPSKLYFFVSEMFVNVKY
jgi:hypothetical protein